VVVVAAGVHVLENGAVAAEPHLVDQPGLDQQVEVAVDRRARDGVAGAGERGVDLIGVDVAVLCEDSSSRGRIDC
jgi:hypothetical protein